MGTIMVSSEALERLRLWGCDIDEALKRTLDDEEFYISLIAEYKDTLELDKLRALIAGGRMQEAYDIAHSLKGVIGNLGLTPMYTIVSTIVEQLRNGRCKGLDKYADELIEKKKELDYIFS